MAYRKQADIGTGHDIRLTPKKAKTEHRMRQDASRLRNVFGQLADTLPTLSDVDLEEAYNMLSEVLGIEVEAEEQAEVEQIGETRGGNSKVNREGKGSNLPKLFTPVDDYSSYYAVLSTHPIFESVRHLAGVLDRHFKARKFTFPAYDPVECNPRLVQIINVLSECNKILGDCSSMGMRMKQSRNERDATYQTYGIGACFKTWEDLGKGAGWLALLRESCNLVIIERGIREIELRGMAEVDKEIIGTDPGSVILERYILRELFENMLGVLGVTIEEEEEENGGSNGETDVKGGKGSGRNGKKGKAAETEEEKKLKKEKRKAKKFAKLDQYDAMSRSAWKAMGEEWVANVVEGMQKEVLREQMNRLKVIPQGLRGGDGEGWRNLAKVTVLDMRKLCVMCIME